MHRSDNQIIYVHCIFIIRLLNNSTRNPEGIRKWTPSGSVKLVYCYAILLHYFTTTILPVYTFPVLSL